MIGVILLCNSFNKSGLSLSGPAAFPGFRFCRSFKVAGNEILNSSITGLKFT